MCQIITADSNNRQTEMMIAHAAARRSVAPKWFSRQPIGNGVVADQNNRCSPGFRSNSFLAGRSASPCTGEAGRRLNRPRVGTAEPGQIGYE
jgi:hypothetical protein